MSSNPHIVFAGGVTAGHVFPGLAVAHELRKLLPEARVSFYSSGKPWEQSCVKQAGCDYITIPCRPSPRKPWDAFRFFTDNVAGFWSARWLLKEHRATVVVGLGGYASVPTVRAAMALGVPTVLMEANAVPGRATRWLSPSATLVCAAFPEVRHHLKSGVRLRITGNPVRHAFRRLRGAPPRDEESGLFAHNRQLLIVGGSGGAGCLNEYAPRALYKIGEELRGWQIVHQTGEGHVKATHELYGRLGVGALVVSFIDNMAEVLRETDLVVSRAGGTALAELMFAHAAPVLVPFADATDDHQSENAKVLSAAGACQLVAQNDPSGRLDDRLARSLGKFVAEDASRCRLSEKLRAFARPNAACDIAVAVRDLIEPAAMRAAA